MQFPCVSVVLATTHQPKRRRRYSGLRRLVYPRISIYSPSIRQTEVWKSKSWHRLIPNNFHSSPISLDHHRAPLLDRRFWCEATRWINPTTTYSLRLPGSWLGGCWLGGASRRCCKSPGQNSARAALCGKVRWRPRERMCITETEPREL